MEISANVTQTPLPFKQHEDACVAWLEKFVIRLETPSGRPTDQQIQLAQDIHENLPDHLERATQYLELWVDRAKSCGNANEEWSLEEVAIPQSEDGRAPIYRLCFMLDGDDGGWWTVSVHAFDYSTNPHERGFKPFAFCREQG